MPAQKYKYKYRTTIVIGHKPDGAPIRKYIQDNSKAKFDAKVRSVQLLVSRGGAPGKITVEQWVHQWYHTYKEPRIGESQQRNYETQIKHRILPAIGHLPLDSVKPYQLQQLMNDARTIHGELLGRSTAAQLRCFLRQIFEQAEINGLIPATPMRRIELKSKRQKYRRALTADEEAIVRQVATTHYAGPWVLMMLDCGLRRGETVPLSARDLTDDGLIRIDKAVQYGRSNHAKLKTTKTEAGIRFVPIPDYLVDLLDKQSRYFFPAEDGGMLTQTVLTSTWNNFRRACDIAAGAKVCKRKIVEHAFDQAITPHYLRHTYCTNLYRQKVDLRTAQYLMGHKDIQTTANIYSHISREDIAKLKE